MKILQRNLDILKDNIKEQCGCISTAVPSKKNGWVKWRENNVNDIIEISNTWRVHFEDLLIFECQEL